MSRFVLLTNTILLEYIYYDESQINNIGNEWVKNDGFLKLSNLNDNSTSIFNADTSKNTTKNVRDYSYAASDLKSGKFGLLDIDRLVYYNDFDSNLTSTPNLPIVFNNSYNTIYDKVRVHLAQNFDFEGFDGFILDIAYPKSDGKNVRFLSIAYNKFDDYRTLNSESFIFGGRFFSSYIEFYIPSYYNLKLKYYTQPLNGDTPTERFSDFIGWKRDGSIRIQFGWVENRLKVVPNDYIFVYKRKEALLPDRDPYYEIGAQVVESTNGDYLELYPTYKGANVSNFLNDLNSVGNDYIIIHDIAVSEYIGNGLNQSLINGAWVLTTTLSISQDSGFENPIMYRPIIENNNAVAYRIDYIARLYDRNTNMQVWKRGSLLSFAPRKYAKNLTRIDLGSLRPQNVIYNQILNNSITFNNPLNTFIEPNIRYINTFVSTNNIAASFSIDAPIENTTATTTDLVNSIFTGTLKSSNKSLRNTSKTFENGALKILITDSGNFCRFIFKDIAPNGGFMLKDLTTVNDLRLRFYRGDGTFVEIIESRNTTDEREKGEVTFAIQTEDAKRIKTFKGRSFNVVAVGDDFSESVLYTGEFLLQDEYIKDLKNNNIENLNTQIANLKSDALKKDTDINNLNSRVADLETQETALKSTIDTLRKALDEAKSKLGEQKLLDPAMTKTINNAKNSIDNVKITTTSKLQIESANKSKITPKTGKASFYKP
jgi:hypothetical protein